MSTIQMTHVDASQFASGLNATASIPTQAEYTLAPDVLLIPVEDGTARLLDMGGIFFTVSEVGAMMLQIVLKRGTEAAVAEVSRHFNAGAEQVRQDLDAMLADFEAKKLVRKTGAARHMQRRGRQLVAQFLALALPLICRGPWSLKIKAWALLLAARVSCATAGWAATVRAWTGRTSAVGSGEASVAAVNEVDQAVLAMASKHLFRVECKERALSCWALARAAGANAELVVGIQLFPVSGHCWCEVGSTKLSDDLSRISEYRPVARWR